MCLDGIETVVGLSPQFQTAVTGLGAVRIGIDSGKEGASGERLPSDLRGGEKPETSSDE